jgi:hypothetical protein
MGVNEGRGTAPQSDVSIFRALFATVRLCIISLRASPVRI